MSVRIVEKTASTQGAGWQFGRRAFLAQSTALMVALGMPVQKAKAVAGKLYQAGESTAVNGFAEEVIFSISSRFTHALSAEERATVHHVVKDLCQQAGLPEFDIHIDWNDSSLGAMSLADLVQGSSDALTVGDVVGRAVASNLRTQLAALGDEATSAVAKGFKLPEQVATLVDGGFTVEGLKSTSANAPAPHDPINVYEHTEQMLVDRMLAGLPRSAKSVDAKLPAPHGEHVSLPLAGSGGEMEQAYASGISRGWLNSQFTDAEFSDARRFVEKLVRTEFEGGSEALQAVGINFVRTDLAGVNPVNMVLAKSAELTANPEALMAKMEQRIDEAQAELNSSLERFETLSEELSDMPLQFAENVPEQRYILSDLGGADELLAQEMVNELNQHHQRAAELAQEIVNLQIQVEDLSIDAYDEEVFGGKFAALNTLLSDSVSGLIETASTLQHLDPSLVTMDADNYKQSVEAVVAELHEAMERHKELASFDMAPRDWALTKAYASQMLVQIAQLEGVAVAALGVDDHEPALASVLKTFGRYTGHAPIENLDTVTREQLIIRTEDSAKTVSEALQAVRQQLVSATQVSGGQLVERMAKVIGAHLSSTDSAFEKAAASLSASTVAELVAAAGVKTYSETVLQGVGADAVAGGLSMAIAEGLIEASKSVSGLEAAIAGRSAAELSASSVHYLGFDLAKAVMKEPIASVLSNYCGTLLHSSLEADTIDVSAFGYVSDATRNEAIAASEQAGLRIDSVREGLGRASLGAADAMAAHVLPTAAEQARDLVMQQAPRALGVDLA